MKIRKRASTAAIASVLLFSNISIAMAGEMTSAASSSKPVSMPDGDIAERPEDTKISKDQAIELAKSYITIPDGYTIESVNLSSSSFNGHRGFHWNLSFVKLVDNRSIGNINLTIDRMNGKLLQYDSYSYDPDDKPSFPPKVDLQGAKDIAAKWVARLYPAEREQLLYHDILEPSLKAPLNDSHMYLIRYDRTHNGVPFPQDGVTIQINGDGIVKNSSFNWDERVTFKPATPMSQEAAAKAFSDKLVPKLNYMLPSEVSGERKPLLAYHIKTPALNAVTGQLWEESAASVGQQSEQPLTNKPLSGPAASNLNLTKEQAFEKISSTFKLPQGIKLEDASYAETTTFNPLTGEERSVWNLNWSQEQEEAVTGRGSLSISASVDSKTGEITQYSRYPNMPYAEPNSVQPRITRQEAKEKAIDFIKIQLPAYTDQLVLDVSAWDNMPAEQVNMMTDWVYVFTRIVDGVHVNYEGVNVSIDKATGDISNYIFNFSNVVYPLQKPVVIDVNKARELLLSAYALKLQYMLPSQPAGISPTPRSEMMSFVKLPQGMGSHGKQDTEAKLVYAWVSKYSDNNYFLDAINGQWRSSARGEVISLGKVTVADIEGHLAQKELQLMLDYQALDVVDGQVRPNAPITRGELVKMLVIAMGGERSGVYYGADRAASFKDVSNESPLFAYVEQAVDRGLIERGQALNPQSIINREEMAELIVRALGYKKLTAYETIFSNSFKDRNLLKNHSGAAIVTGLGIMALSDGSFNPGQEVTRAQAAVVLYRYLEKAAELKP